MSTRKPTNPFYVAALPMGILFALTACAYVVMMVRAIGPQPTEATGLIDWLNRYGMLLLMAELAALATLTVAAIASDDFWTRRFESKQVRSGPLEETP